MGCARCPACPSSPSLSSLAQNGEASISSSSISKVAVLPLLADATASSVTLADAPFQGSVALPQTQSKQGRSKAKQQDSSKQWAREVIKVITFADATYDTCAEQIGWLQVHDAHKSRKLLAVAYVQASDQLCNLA